MASSSSSPSAYSLWIDSLPWMDILLTPPREASNRLAIAWHEFMQAAAALKNELEFPTESGIAVQWGPEERLLSTYKVYQTAAVSEFEDDYTQALAFYVARNNLAVVTLQLTLIGTEHRFNAGTPLDDLKDEILYAREALRQADIELEKAVQPSH